MRAARLSTLVLTSLASLAACGEPAPAVTPAPPTSASVAPPLPPPAKATTVKRTVVSLGRVVGSDVVTTEPNGHGTIAFDVHENGRGPHVDATFELETDHTFKRLDARGHHEMGTPVEESFVREGEQARWKSHEENAKRDVLAASFYIPFCQLPDAVGYLAQALIRRGSAMPLLPSGEASIEKTGEATVKGKSGERHVTSYAITGADLGPWRVWMNDDGSWFGVVDPWFSVVPEGFEGVIDALVEKQNESEKARDAKIAKEVMRKPPAAGLAYTHARVLDVEKGRWLSDQTVVIASETITAVGPSASVKVPAGAETIDLAGKAIVPGLWDMHAHLGPSDGALNLASGVTTVRDVGNDPDKLDDWKKRYDDGSAVGPHVLRFGFIEGRGEHAASSKVTAETETEAKAAVEFFAKRGYEGIKIYNSMKPELVPLLAKEAHARGMGVSGHIPVHMLANEAVKAGYDGIEHVNMLFLNFFADHDTDTRTPLRFSLVAEKAAGFDLKGKPMKDFIALLRDKKTIIDPTIGVFENLFSARPGQLLHGIENAVARLPPQTQRGFLFGGLPASGKEELYDASFEKVLALVKLLRDEKISLVAGTDGLAGFALHHEIALFVRAGIPAAEAIRMATLDPARLMKKDKQSGSIAVGKTADLVVIDGDPLAHVTDLSNVAMTVKSGTIVRVAPLFASLGAKPPPAAVR